jgi:hypothetical protein
MDQISVLADIKLSQCVPISIQNLQGRAIGHIKRWYGIDIEAQVLKIGLFSDDQ